MSPVEKYPATGYKPREESITGAIDYDSELVPAVEIVCRRHGLLQVDDGEDGQTGERFRIFTVGTSDSDAMAVVLIGNEVENSFDIADIGTEKRPHKMVSSQRIIDEVRTELTKVPQKV